MKFLRNSQSSDVIKFLFSTLNKSACYEQLVTEYINRTDYHKAANLVADLYQKYNLRIKGSTMSNLMDQLVEHRDIESIEILSKAYNGVRYLL